MNNAGTDARRGASSRDQATYDAVVTEGQQANAAFTGQSADALRAIADRNPDTALALSTARRVAATGLDVRVYRIGATGPTEEPDEAAALEVERLLARSLAPWGGGIEAMVSPHVSFIAEYTQTNFGKLHIEPVTIEPVAHAFRLGLNYRFSGSIFGDCMRC